MAHEGKLKDLGTSGRSYDGMWIGPIFRAQDTQLQHHGCVRKASRPSPSIRRTLQTSAGDASNRVQEFLDVFVTNDGRTTSQVRRNSYLCKSCFKRTESLQRRLVAVGTSINTLRAQVCGGFSSPIQLFFNGPTPAQLTMRS